MSNQKKLGVVTYSVFVFFLFAESAQAYVDPGTGSYLFQLLIAGILGSLFFIKTIIQTMKSSLHKMLSRKNNLEPAEAVNKLDGNDNE